ncbi:MAG: benzoate-CoA ligase family protein [Acidobacteriota bacterium]
MTDAAINLTHYFFSETKNQNLQNRIAIEYRSQKITYGELTEAIGSAGEFLLGKGILPGDRVGLWLHDSPDFIVFFLAVISIDAIAIPINTYIPAKEIEFILKDAGVRFLIAHHDLIVKGIDTLSGSLEVLSLDVNQSVSFARSLQLEQPVKHQGFQGQSKPENPAFILYTSGSTGTPKGAIHRQRDVIFTIETYAKNILRLTENDKIFSSSRLYFAYGLGNSLSFPLGAGCTVILEPERPTPPLIAKIFKQQQPTVFFGVPAVYRALLDFHQSIERLNVANIRLWVSAGEALPAAIFHEWKHEFGMEILDGIGSTEMLHIFISNHPGKARAGSSGQVVSGYEAKLVDEQGNELAGEGTGNLYVKGDSAMLGYWQREGLTGQVIQDDWVKTGDVYRRDNENYFYHIGRTDDCFKVKGLWVSPIEVESALLEHPAIVEAAVIAGTTATGLATAKAFLVIRKEQAEILTADEIISFMCDRLPTYKIPTAYEFIDEMPRTTTGKVQRFKLRKLD